MTSPQNPNQILIVEDELILAKRVARQLEQQGYGIADICTTGQAALEHFERCQPNLVLMDIALPGEWDGIEAAARIRERADIPLIYLTAYADDATLARAEATGGACGYLTKPYRECELRTTVKMALTQHQVRQRERTQAQQAHQAQLEELTHGDGITGLPNQLALHEQFARLLADRGEGTTLPVLCLHLDRGRALEATFGTGTQNTLTQNAAQRLQAQVSERDLLASLGEGQFAVVVGDGRAGPERAQHLLACLNRLTALAGQEVALTASAGLAHYPDNGTQLDGLLAQASQAAERAAAGGNQYRHAQPQQAAASRDRLALETALRYALDRQQFQLHYQPRIALATGQTVGAEALLRWLHPEWGNIPPGRFIPIAEETGTILEIGEWVARTASRQLQAWNQRLRHPLALAVNLSGRQFESEQLVQQLAALGQPPLELELTETLLVAEPERARQQLQQLVGAGLRIAIDDFGTGYSSLSYLKQFPFQILKIDRAFVRHVDSDERNAAIVTAVLQMAQQLQLRVVAEGVETEAERAFLAHHGCPEAQG